MSTTDSLVFDFQDIIHLPNNFGNSKCSKRGTIAGNILLNKHSDNIPLKPSEFTYKMSLSSEDLYKQLIYGHVPETLALHDMSLIGDQKVTSFPVDRPLFQPFPSELVFQRFEPGRSYELPLLLRNMDKVSRTAHLIQNDTPYFKIKHLGAHGTKVAADAHQDYHHDLMCVTDRELFSIPVFCIGPRAVLDLPDEVDFGEVPVKKLCKRVLGIRNIGDGVALPVVLKIEPGSLEEIIISFIPENAIDISRKMLIIYDTGEKLKIELRGKGIEALVKLKDDSVKMNDTFIGLQAKSSIFIQNQSSDFISYKWSPFKNADEESFVNETLIETFANTGNFESRMKEKLITWIRKFSEQQIPYPTSIQTAECSPFNIEPIEGRIQPYSLQEFTLHFNPEKVKSYQDIFYCDVEGLTERLSLTIHGEGLGPKIKFSFKCLNMGKLFIGSKHKYELVLSNSGLIDTMFSIQSKNVIPTPEDDVVVNTSEDVDVNNQCVRRFAKYFHFTPDEGLICPGGYQVIQIEFKCDDLLGEFNETFKFEFDGSSTAEEILFSGTVVGPTFHFNVSSVEFNQVSYGFSEEKTIILHNTSFIPMDFILRVVHDDNVDSKIELLNTIPLNSNDNNKSDESVDISPIQEQYSYETSDLAAFQITPSNGNLLAMSSINIVIRFSPKCLGCRKYKLIVDVVNVGKEEHWIPIFVEAIRPDVVVTPEYINLTRCFINHPYVVQLTLTNQSTQPASYQFVEQASKIKEINQLTRTSAVGKYSNDDDGDNKLQYWTNDTKGIIRASDSIKLPVTFKAKTLGLITTELYIKICGINENPLKIPVRCVGEGPVLHVEQTKLEWGIIPVLQPIIKVLKITNESCIDAVYTTKMLRSDTVFQVEPSTGSIPGYGHVDLNITTYLNDIITFKDQLEIHIEHNTKPLKIELCAIGQGGTIVTQPPMGSTLNLGCQFSVNPMRKQFKVINKGRRQQQLIWSIEGQSLRKSIHTDSQSLTKPETKWTITPHRFEINPGASAEICLEVQCDSPKTIHDKILCHSIIGRSAKYLIKTVDVTIDFITPVIELSTSELFYRVEKGPSDKLSIQFNQFTMTNKVDLILTCSLEICSPFHLYVDGNYTSTMTFQMNPLESKEITVAFNPIYKDDLISRRADELLFIKYAEHPQTDAVRVIGEVHFPNLQFEADIIDFGCILNYTEMTKHTLMKNVSPLPVKFRWSLLIGNRANIIFKRQARLTEPYPSAVDETVGSHHVNPDENYEQDKATMKDENVSGTHTEEMGVSTQENESLQVTPPCGVNKPNGENVSENLNPEQLTPENSVLRHLLEEDGDIIPLGIEELFDIVPLYGEISPGESITLSCTFFGHADIEASVTALCEVEGGPEYKIELKGSASEINYLIDQTVIDLGFNRMDKPMICEFNIMNTGKVIFDFYINIPQHFPFVKNTETTILVNNDDFGQLKIEPSHGQVNSDQSHSVRLTYISFKPGYFEQEIDVQIAHFQPKRIKLHGVADFAHLNLNLPRAHMVQQTNKKELNIENQSDDEEESSHNYYPSVYEFTMQKLMGHLRQEVMKLLELWKKQQNAEMFCLCHTPFSSRSQSLVNSIKNKHLDEIFMHDTMCCITKALKQILSNQYYLVHVIPDNILQMIPDLNLQLDAECEHICRLLNNEIYIKHNNYFEMMTEADQSVKPLLLNNLYLPHYLLDFGVVIMGTCVKQSVYAINTSCEPISFRYDTVSLSKAKQLGFSTNITKIHHLPGYPDYEQVELEFTFDTKQAGQIDECLIQTELIIKVLNGPSIPIWLRANIVKPMLKSHVNTIDFGEVQRGEARLFTIQLHNPSPVSISWYRCIPELQNNKMITESTYPIRMAYKSRRNRLKDKQLRIFEVIPNRGVLEPDDKINIQIQFTPLEEKRYETKILLNIENSDTVLKIHCQGKGLEPQLIFDRVLLQFSPTLPFSSMGSEEIVTVTNPCGYPIEFYSLELDKQVLLEDEILRSLNGYDEYGNLLLPPRKPGDPLPTELIAYYEEQIKLSNSKLSEELEDNTPVENVADEKNIKEIKFSEVSPSSWKETKKSNTTTTTTTTTTNNTSTSESDRNKPDSRSTMSDLFLDNIKREDSKLSNLNIFTSGKQTLDVTPVSLALSRYLGMDSHQEACKSDQLGIAILVNGALESIRQNVINRLAKQYNAIVLNINQIIIEALLTSTSDTACQARQICLDVGEQIIQTKLLEKQKEQQEREQEEQRQLQLQQQQQLQLQLSDAELKPDSPKELRSDITKDDTIHEVISQNKPLNRLGVTGNKNLAHRRTSNEPGKINDTLPVSPRSNSMFKSKCINFSIFSGQIKSCANSMNDNNNKTPTLVIPPTDQLYTTILPDDIILHLIKERFKQSDCLDHKNIIIDGLESDFTKNSLSTIEILLKCLKDCKYIYTISIKSDYEKYKQCLLEIQAEMNENQLISTREYYKKLDDITDYEYAALSDSERKQIFDFQLKIRREKRQIQLEQKRIQEEQFREEQEAEAKRLEMERNKKRGKRIDEKSTKPNAPNQISLKENRALSGRMSSKSVKDVGNNNNNSFNTAKTELLEKSPLGTLEETRRTSRSHDKHRKSATSFKDEAITEEETGTRMTDEEQLAYQVFKSFDGEFRNICEFLSTWNRVTLQQQSSLLEGREDSPTSTVVNLPAGKRARQSGLNLPPNASSINLNKSKHSISKVNSSNIQSIQENMTVLLPIYCELSQFNDSTNEIKVEKYAGDSDSQVIGIPHLIVEIPFRKETNITEEIRGEITSILNNSNTIYVQNLIGRTIKESLMSANDHVTHRMSEGVDEEEQEGAHKKHQQQKDKLFNELYQLLYPHLPELSEILDHLGIGPNGPPIPKPNNFSVIHYPLYRETITSTSVSVNENHSVCGDKTVNNKSLKKPMKISDHKTCIINLKYFEFLYSGQGDPMMASAQFGGFSQVTGSIEEEMETVESSVKQKEQVGESLRKTVSRSGRKERKSPRQKLQMADSGEMTSRKQKMSVTSGLRNSITSVISEQLSVNDEISSIESSQLLSGQPLNQFRWIVPAKGQVRLRIRFRCEQVGQYDQIFNFELLNTRRIYQLYCRGECTLPTISREPRLIYAKRKRTLNQGEIIHGTYLMSTSCFEFGPLLIEKSKERIQENCYPENITYFNLVNTSQMDTDIKLGFLYDINEDCYSVQPNQLSLQPNQSSTVKICAFPKLHKRYIDALVCSIKDNPEPIQLKLACDGVLPELELDKKAFNFEKVLLQRKEVRSIVLKNNTLLPAQWKLSGIEALGDEFSISQDAGIVEPKSECIVYAYFRAMKPVKSNQKKNLRLEVYDLENIAGLIQVETIQVIAEAYDVALDINFPKGSDGGIDFGLIKVGEEVKHAITLKNKGPYEIIVNFIFSKNAAMKMNYTEVFTMSPQRISLSPTDKSAQINLTCCAQTECILKEVELIKCQIVEPNAKGTPQLIASIPIKVSVRAVFSKFTISPAKDINFGSLILNNYKSRQLIIENNGDYEFRFSIIRMSRMFELMTAREAHMNKEIVGAGKHKIPYRKSKRSDPTMLSSPQARLQQGFFTLAPASGLIPPGNAQIITVDCMANSQDLCEEELTIEITDRDMNAYPHGIPYRLIAEGHLPSIETDNYSLIFEEHHVCKNLTILDLPDFSDKISSSGIYGIEENRFVYRNVLVGSRVGARFRIFNQSNVPADVTFEISYTGVMNSNQPSGRSSSRGSQTTSYEAFEVIPDKVRIEPHSSIYANVIFAPTAMQTYTANFHAYLENKSPTNPTVNSGRGSATSSSKRSTNTPVLTFELYGQGNLPQISILQPKLRNRAGQAMCIFKRMQVGRTSTQTLTLHNNGILNSRVNIDLVDPDGVFSLKPQLHNDALLFYNPIIKANEYNGGCEESNLTGNDELSVSKQSHLIGLLLRPDNQFSITIHYMPNKRNIKNFGQVHLSLVNNEYEDTLVELIGEALNDEVCLEDVPQLDYEKHVCIQNALRRVISASKPAPSSQSNLDDLDSDPGQDETQTALALRHNHLDFGDCGPNEAITRTITLTHCGKVKDTEPTSFRFTWPTNNPVLQFKPSEGHLHVNQSRRIEVTFKPSGTPITLKSQSVKCSLHRIIVSVPEGCSKPVDWDDTKQVIRWLDLPGERGNGVDSTSRSAATTTTTATTNSNKVINQQATAAAATTAASPHGSQELLAQFNLNYGSANEVIRRKHKVIEIEAEPNYEEILDQPDPKPLELFISGVADFTQHKCDVSRIDFKDTHIFEKRIYRFEFINSGLITLHFNWSIQMTSSTPDENSNNNNNNTSNEGCNEHWDISLVPFTVDPIQGDILPGKSKFIQVTFSPLLLGEFEAQLTGRIDNLLQQSTTSNRNRPILSQPVITITGKSENSILHFDLYDSDYLSGGRRNPELQELTGTPLGASLDPSTRVIEYSIVGLGVRKTRYFSVINTTKENFEFTIENADSISMKEPQSVKCLVDKGTIEAGKKINIGFEFIAYQLGLIESFWRFNVEKFGYSVPMLIVGETREPNIMFDQSHINFNAVLIGHKVSKNVLLINQEVPPPSSSLSTSDYAIMNVEEHSSDILEFEFLKSSLYSAGKQDSVTVEPMSGHISPGEKLPIQITFQALGEREVNINLQCRIKHRNLPLTLNIKAQGYTIHSSIWIDYSTNDSITNLPTTIEQVEIQPLWSPCLGVDITDLMNTCLDRIKRDRHIGSKLAELKFGELIPGECITRKLTIHNSGKFKIDFLCQFMPIPVDSDNKGEITSSNKKMNLINSMINGLSTDNGFQSPSLKITPNSGSLPPNGKFTCTIMFQPPKRLSLLGIQRLKLNNLLGLCLVVRDGPVYGIKLSGSTKRQTVQFSTTCINFGSQLLMQPGLKPSTRYLYIGNSDTNQEMSIECISQSSKIFTYTLAPTILPKKQQEDTNEQSRSVLCMPIEFYPYEDKLYTETMIFEINGCSQYSIELSGKGCKLNIEPIVHPLLLINKNKNGILKITQISESDHLTDNKRCVNLGHLKSGQMSRRYISLVNKSNASVCIHKIHLNQPTVVVTGNNDEKKSINIQLCNSIPVERQCSYTGPITEVATPLIIPPNGGEIMAMLSLTSDKRIPEFNEEVLCEISRVDQDNAVVLPKTEMLTTMSEASVGAETNTNMFLSIFSVHGAVNTYDIDFNIDSISFGSVVRGSQLAKRIVLINSGDYGAKFEWDKSTFTSDLLIEPMNGFIGPGLEVPFTLTLKPNKLTREIRMENVTCRIQGAGQKTITITGACVPPTIIKEAQQFTTTVRQSDTKKLQIANRSNTDWQIKPVISGEQWSGSKIFEIPAQQTGVYELNYKPVTMTTDGAKHKGTIFFPLPDGTGLLYNLLGISESPKSMMRINREIECKKLHTEIVQIPNWLNNLQRFRVTKEILRPDKSDSSTTIQGLNYIDVPADSSKEYKLSIFTYREGLTLVKVTFTNDTTGEYQFFEINFKSVRSRSLDIIKMQTPVRKPTIYTLTLENPLPIPVNFQLNTNIPEVQCPSQLQIPANCEGNVTLEYLPIKVGQSTGKFEATCNELGLFSYELDLQATPSGFESTLHFRTNIGQRHCQMVKFTNMTKNKTEFIANIDHCDFHCEKQVSVAAGVDATLEVIFEPTSIGSGVATLTITSTHAGEYNFLLKGTALPPQPQGPIMIKAGETKHIVFRNVFPTPILYSFQVDNTVFNLPKQSEIIRPNKEFRIPIGLDDNVTRSPVTGKLVVTAVRAQSSARITRKGQTTGTAVDGAYSSSPSSTSSPQQQQQTASSPDIRSTEKGEGFQWVYYLRGVMS